MGAQRTKFHRIQPCYNFNFILVACTCTSNVILVWKEFEGFNTLRDFIEPLKTYIITTYLNLIHFLISWVFSRKREVQGLPLVGPRCENPTPWRLGLRGMKK